MATALKETIISLTSSNGDNGKLSHLAAVAVGRWP